MDILLDKIALAIILDGQNLQINILITALRNVVKVQVYFLLFEPLLPPSLALKQIKIDSSNQT